MYFVVVILCLLPHPRVTVWCDKHVPHAWFYLDNRAHSWPSVLITRPWDQNTYSIWGPRRDYHPLISDISTFEEVVRHIFPLTICIIPFRSIYLKVLMITLSSVFIRYIPPYVDKCVKAWQLCMLCCAPVYRVCCCMINARKAVFITMHHILDHISVILSLKKHNSLFYCMVT